MKKVFYLFLPLSLLFVSASEKQDAEKSCVEKMVCQKPDNDVQTAETLTARRVYAHLHLADTASAAIEAENFLKTTPASKLMQRALIRALANRGEEMKALEQYGKSILMFEELKEDPSLIEEIAWGILQKGQNSAQFPIKVSSLLGASFTNDVRAIPLILEHLRNSNAYMRALSAKLCSMLGDEILKDELLTLLQKEKVWYVRLSIIDSLGMMKVKKAFPVLQEIIANPQTIAEERASAIIALSSLYEKIDKSELQGLVRSSRAGLRELSCQIIMHFELVENAHFLIDLIQDPSPHVRVAALNALGFLRVEQWQEKPLWEVVGSCMQDSDPVVQITAGWLATLLRQECGPQLLEAKIAGQVPEERRLAAAALAVTGKSGQKLASHMLRVSKDPYVKATLAMSLIGQRVDVKLATDTLYEFSMKKEDLWMWENHLNPFFRSLGPSRVKHIEQIPHYPVVVDQFVRLEILSILSVMERPKAEIAVKEFLKNSTWGITSSAAALLLQEGGEEALSIIKNLLKDPDGKIRIQAALVLAIVGNDYSAIEVLQKAYPFVDRDLKVHILEAIAHIGDPSCVPFLVQILSEPFQVLRVIAACAIIQCLHH